MHVEVALQFGLRAGGGLSYSYGDYRPLDGESDDVGAANDWLRRVRNHERPQLPVAVDHELRAELARRSRCAGIGRSLYQRCHTAGNGLKYLKIEVGRKVRDDSP